MKNPHFSLMSIRLQSWLLFLLSIGMAVFLPDGLEPFPYFWKLMLLFGSVVWTVDVILTDRGRSAFPGWKS